MKLSISKNKRTFHPEILMKVYIWLAARLQNEINKKISNFTVYTFQNNTHFQLHYLMRTCNQGISAPEDLF